MKLLEHNAKELFRKYSIPTMPGRVVSALSDIPDALEALHFPIVVKAQVQVGGRGKAGGIRVAHHQAEAEQHCRDLLFSTLKGHRVESLLLEEMASIQSEWYFSILLDRLSKKPLIMFSAQGGIDIEEVARVNPQAIIKLVIDPIIGVQESMARYLLSKSGQNQALASAVFDIIKRLYRLFVEYDSLLCEINPLILSSSGDLIALDGKMEVDDSALYRLPDIEKLRSALPEEPLETEARSYGFLFIPVEDAGSIVACSNGSGMLMSCIDMISKESMSVRAALDLGGGATADRITKAIGILSSVSGTKAILINIFGGITRCDEVANGVRQAQAEGKLEGKLLVIRMEGTNKELGVEIIRSLKSSSIILADGLKESIAALTERRSLL